MALKRPFDEEVVGEVSCKHRRHAGPGAEIISHNDSFSEEADIVKIHDSDARNIGKSNVDYDDDSENGNCPDIHREGVLETENDVSGSVSLSHWANSGTSDEDEPPKEMLHVPFYAGYFSFDRPAINPEDVYHCFLDYPPRKQVPIGPLYQAEIPPWGEDTSKESYSRDGVELNGTCIIPNLNTQPLAHDMFKVGDGRIDCECPDRGSIRCVRFHIAETRDTLRRVISQDTFMELGFDDMGEVVADKWTNEEELLFHEVVYSNPVHLGKNFWCALSAVFPLRTKMEIISYYFNVFMLRKQAEQNRYDRMSVDSENDEWQVTVLMMIVTPGLSLLYVSHVGLMFRQNELHVPEHEDDDGDISDEVRETNNPEGLIQKCDANSALELQGKKSDDGEDNDAQDGSCTSSDSGASVQATQIKSDASHDSTDAKAWNRYMSCPKSNVVFLTTCSMIEKRFSE